jgi:hypothetical protein
MNEGLKKNYEERTRVTKEKIDKAIEKLKTDNKKFTSSNIAKVSGLSRPTIYAYKDYIQEKIPLKITKSKKVKELETIIKTLKKELKNIKEENKNLKIQNTKLIEVQVGMKEYIKEIKI